MLLTLLFSLVATPAVAEPVAPAAAHAAAIDGTWKRHDPNADARIDQAIEEVVSQMAFLIRPVARSRLKASLHVPEAVRIQREGESVVVALQEDPGEPLEPVRGTLGAAPIPVPGSDDPTLRVSFAVNDKGHLVQTFRTSEGGQRRTYVMEGDSLVIYSSIFSPQLPKDVRYEIRYKRAAN